MTIKKYSARPGYFPTIDVIDVDRESDSHVWLEGMRVQKTTKYEAFTETFEEAKAHLLNLAMSELTAQALILKRAGKAYERALELKEPA